MYIRSFIYVVYARLRSVYVGLHWLTFGGLRSGYVRLTFVYIRFMFGLRSFYVRLRSACVGLRWLTFGGERSAYVRLTFFYVCFDSVAFALRSSEI